MIRWASFLTLLVVLTLSAPARAIDFAITYTNTTAAQQAAINAAANYWKSWVTNSRTGDANTVELAISFASLGSGILGQTSTNWIANSGGYALTPAQYMMTTGTDLQSTDATIQFSSDFPWYTGTDGHPAAGLYDLETVVIHEMGHMMGMLDSYHSPRLNRHYWGDQDSVTNAWQLTRWDSYLRDENGTAPNPTSHSASLDATGTVTFNGPNAVAAYGGPVPVYSPNPYEPGSSLAHIDPSFGLPVMTYAVSDGIAKHGLYDYEIGIFKDVGWSFVTPTEVHTFGGPNNYYWQNGSAYTVGLPPSAATAVYLDATGTAYSILVAKAVSAASVAVRSSASRLDVQAGGSLTVTGDLSVSNGGAVTQAAGITCVNLSIGSDGTAGTFTQTAGALAVAGTFRVGPGLPGSTVYTGSGGSLSAATIDIGNAGAGSFNITNAAESLTVTSLLNFGSGATVNFATGTSLRLRNGAAVTNASTSASAVALANLNLIVEGGAAVSDLEAAGRDYGPATAGFTSNFMFGTLTLGGTADGRIKLLDASVNSPGYPEAMYVNNLVINPGAAVDLNGQKLYYRNGGAIRQLFPGDVNLDGAVDISDLTLMSNVYGTAGGMAWGNGDFNGDRAVDISDLTIMSNYYASVTGASDAQVPEPTTMGILLSGVSLLIRRRRTDH